MRERMDGASTRIPAGSVRVVATGGVGLAALAATSVFAPWQVVVSWWDVAAAPLVGGAPAAAGTAHVSEGPRWREG